MVMLLLDRGYDSAALADADELDIRNISLRNWKVVLGIRRATNLGLYHITTPDLEGLEGLQTVRSLAMKWATKVATVEPVFAMAALTSLAISDFPKLQDLVGVEQLTALTALSLSGNLGSLSPPLKLRSIGPVASLPSLKEFSLSNARLEDDDITVLAACRDLEQLELSNQFEKRQFAYLAKHLNSKLKQPIQASRESSVKCKTCGGGMRMVTGRRMPFLCGSCDPARLSKAEAEFAKLVEEA